MNQTLLLALLAIATSAAAQPFNSGSTGADGPLELTKPGTVTFDPRSFNPPLNPAGDNIFHFTTIHVGIGVTVKLSAKALIRPVFWLAEGPVQIDGRIDLSGSDGDRVPSLAGAGGYGGGAVGKRASGPVGFTPNIFLVPLVGGFGGDGGETRAGGAGGGALLIASSAFINVNGSISGDGGNSVDGVGGGGGAIRLVAPVISGATGVLSAKGGQPQGADGFVRLEAFDNQFKGSLNGTPSAVGKPFGLFLPPNPPASVRVVSIGGRAVSTSEFKINQQGPAIVAIEAHFIPTGTVLQLELFSEDGNSQTIAVTPLAGTFELSHATASITPPIGLIHAQVKGVWKHPERSPLPDR
jgi:hypothetical protein